VSQHDIKPATRDNSEPQPEAESISEVMYTTVYTFVVYDHDQGKTVIYSRMATRQTIAQMRGKVNEDSAWVVEDRELDAMGFYSGDKLPGRDG
jgi:hypothetical protein